MGQSEKASPARVLRAAFAATVPVLAGFSFLGLAYGILMASKGYGPIWSALFSAICFCGSMQYAAMGLLTTVFDPLSAFVLSVMVNARHLFYGLSMLEKYKGLGKIKGFLVYTLCDETFSVNCAAEVPADIAPGQFYFAVSLLDYLYWVAASAIGGVVGGFITVDITGIDFVLTALFVVILLGQLEKRENRKSAAVGVGCSVLCLAVFGPGGFILPAMGLILLCLAAGAAWEKRRGEVCR